MRPNNHASKLVAERLCEGTLELRGSTSDYWLHYRAERRGEVKQWRQVYDLRQLQARY
jgi:hypothetical protein